MISNAMSELDGNQSLHLLKKQIKQSYVTRQAEFIRQNLGNLIAATERVVPNRRPRSKGPGEDLFCLRRDLTEEERLLPERTRPEDCLERAAWCHWHKPGRPVLGAWERLVTFQMPLKDANADQGWGDVDLLGLSSDGLPVIVELKRADSAEPVLAVMVQALAYGVALRKAWPCFREHWQKALDRMEVRAEVPSVLGNCPLICAAPDDYWQCALAKKRGRMWLDLEMRQTLCDLAAEFGKHGYPVGFVSLKTGDGTQTHLLGAKEIKLTELSQFL